MESTEEKILNEILKNTYTFESFKKRTQALKLKLEGKIYGSDKGHEVAGDSQSEEEAESKKFDNEAKVEKHEVSPAHGSSLTSEAKWVEAFDPNLLSEIKSDSLSNITEYFDTFLKNIQLVTIYLVFLPEEKQIEEVGEWLRKNMNNPKLIFDVKVDPSLIGGCAIVHKGVYKDFSLRGRIYAKRDFLVKEFRGFMKNG